MQNYPIVILGMARTPQGNLLGALKDLSSPELGSKAIIAAIERSAIKPEDVNEVLMGCVLPAGIGQAPARQAALKAGIPSSTPCTTINKVCGSGMKTVMLAHDALLVEPSSIIVAGGMESMSNAPYLLLKARQGYRLGHDVFIDHMLRDGLEDAYEQGRSMGYFAEKFAQENHFTRAQQDAYATRSLERAQQSIQNKTFANEIIPISIKTKTGSHLVENDEHPGSVNIEKIPLLSPVFAKEGTVTAANSASIADGAAAIVLTSLQETERRGLKPLAKIIGQCSYAKAPAEFTSAPIDAINKLLKKISWTIDDVDLFEINEAFAVVTLACIRDLKIPIEKLNIHGGACALGHPIGASGTRIIVTLIAALQKNHLKRGIASLCIGGGEATAVAVELL